MFTRHSTSEPKPISDTSRIDSLRLQSLAPLSGRAPSEQPPPQPTATTAAPAPTATPSSGALSTPYSIIGKDLTIIGQGLRIISKGKIQVDGEIHGDVLGSEVVIGSDGKVTGVVSAETIKVCGAVQGTIRGLRVFLEAGAKVEGDVHHQTLSVDEGAELEGRVRRVRDEAELRPDLTQHQMAS